MYSSSYELNYICSTFLKQNVLLSVNSLNWLVCVNEWGYFKKLEADLICIAGGICLKVIFVLIAGCWRNLWKDVATIIKRISRITGFV